MGLEAVGDGLDGGGDEGVIGEEVLDGGILDFRVEGALVGVVIAAEADAGDEGEEVPELHGVAELVVGIDAVVVIILERGVRLGEGEAEAGGAGLAIVEEV